MVGVYFCEINIINSPSGVEKRKMSQETEEEIQAEKPAKKNMSKKTKQLLVVSIVIVIVFIIVGGITWLYTGTLTSAKEKVFNYLPLPAAIVDLKFIPAKTVISRVNLAKQIAGIQGATSEISGSDVFDQLLESKKIEAVANKYGVTASTKSIDDEYQNIIKQYAGGDEAKFKEELTKTYQMDPEQFKTEVIRQEILQSQLMLWFNKQENLNENPYKKAKEFKDKLSSGGNFDEIAKAYTQDEATKDFAGDSGVIIFDELLPEFQEGLKDAKVGDTNLVASRYGLHILKTLELNNDGPDGAKQTHIQQIFVKTEDFPSWLKKAQESVKASKLLKF